MPIQGGKTLVGYRSRFEALLGIVDQYHREPMKLMRCFYGLMGAYFSLDGCDPRSEVHPQWDALRRRLSHWLPRLAEVQRRPDWLAAALDHRNLFSDDPTTKYGAGVLRGEHADFESACERLGISLYSWMRRRVVISAVEAAACERDDQFRTYLDQLMGILIINDGVRAEGAAKLLNRYARQTATPEYLPLRTFAIDTFGNPLITANKQRWFEVSDAVREMVANWLKGFLIERFFELLSHDGRTDKRRPRFWLKYRGSIETMWFILGPSAMSRWNEDFKELRETMGNQCLSLEGTTAGNNAFIMKIGKVYVVEFGEKGNATYWFDQDLVPFELADTRLHLTHLKSAQNLERLEHRDGRDLWEKKFSDALAFYQFCNERGLRYDNRGPSGRLVFYTDSSNSYISGKLGQWGFVYDRDNHRWIKDP
jgi:hypothetical protein